MEEPEQVSAIMKRHVHTVRLNQELTDVVSILKKYKVRHVPVIEGKELVGIISRTDVNRLTFGALMENQDEADAAIMTMLSIAQVMTHKPRLVNENSTIREVAGIFAKEEYHALPVVDDQGGLTGIVTTKDIIEYLLGQN